MTSWSSLFFRVMLNRRNPLPLPPTPSPPAFFPFGFVVVAVVGVIVVWCWCWWWWWWYCSVIIYKIYAIQFRLCCCYRCSSYCYNNVSPLFSYYYHHFLFLPRLLHFFNFIFLSASQFNHHGWLDVKKQLSFFLFSLQIWSKCLWKDSVGLLRVCNFQSTVTSETVYSGLFQYLQITEGRSW